MSADENRGVIDASYEAGNVGDVDTLMGLLSDDVVWTDIGTTQFSGTFRSKVLGGAG
ncbi:MAG: hypothetical protein R3195_10845 [Gemmatimonadota bacterium]|nr:hypothetical protein [Gemmatimonadota bacterium]